MTVVAVRHGIRENAAQFSVQMLVILLVGLTLGVERTLVPVLGAREFGIGSVAVVGAFVVSFGLVKAAMNLVGGHLSERFGRKPLLVAGWVVALPIPVMLGLAPTWSVVVAANVLLGVSQGLSWSMSVNAKIDLAGDRRRGLAVGLDEAAGYGGVAVAAAATAYLGATYAPRDVLLWTGTSVTVLGLLVSVLLARETLPWARAEAERRPRAAAGSEARTLREAFALGTWRDPTLSALSQAGLVEKFVDTLVWLAFPLLMLARGLDLPAVGLAVGAYGIAWGALQIPAGHLADRVGRKLPIVAGMLLAGVGVAATARALALETWVAGALVAGAGMALLYPNLMTATGDAAGPAWRARALGVYRFWRDLGYAIGALLVGAVADAASLEAAFWVVAAAMIASGLVVAVRMRETHPARSPG